MTESLSQPKRINFDGEVLTYWVAKRMLNVSSVAGTVFLDVGDYLVTDRRMTVMVMSPAAFKRSFGAVAAKQRGKK